MSDKSKVLVAAITAALLVCLAACREEKAADPADAPREAMMAALVALDSCDYDAYCRMADFNVGTDSARLRVFMDAVRQHQDWTHQTKGRLTSYSTLRADMESDTLAYVYYELVFQDSIREVVSQKMVRTNGEWKLRMRD